MTEAQEARVRDLEKHGRVMVHVVRQGSVVVVRYNDKNDPVHFEIAEPEPTYQLVWGLPDASRA